MALGCIWQAVLEGMVSHEGRFQVICVLLLQNYHRFSVVCVLFSSVCVEVWTGIFFTEHS